MTDVQKYKVEFDASSAKCQEIRDLLDDARKERQKAYDKYIAAKLADNGTPIGSKYGKIIVEDCDLDINGNVKTLLGPNHNGDYRSDGVYLEEHFTPPNPIIEEIRL